MSDSCAAPVNQLSMFTGWSNLPPELLDLIAKTFNNYVDYLRLRSVCPAWRSILPRKPWHNHLSQLPWLLHSLDDIKNNNNVGYFNLADNKDYCLELPDLYRHSREINQKQLWGSCYGWTVMVDRGLVFSLFNPLTKAQIMLSSLVRCPSNLAIYEYSKLHLDLPSNCFGMYKANIIKAVLSANLVTNSSFLVMIILEGGLYGLAFYQSGEKAWTVITNSRTKEFYDVSVYKVEFYAIDKEGVVYLCNLGSSLTSSAGTPHLIEVLKPPREECNDIYNTW